MDRVSGGSRQPLHSGNQRKKWGCHWRILLVFMFFGASESFPVSTRAPNSVNLLPFAWKNAPSLSLVQTEDSKITVDSTGDKNSVKETAKDTNSTSYSDRQDWLPKQASPSTTPAKTPTSGESLKKIDTAQGRQSNSEQEIDGFPDVGFMQGLVRGTKTSPSARPQTTKSPVVSASPSPPTSASPSPFASASPSPVVVTSPAIPSVAAPAPELLSPEPGTEVPAMWSDPPPAPESEVAPGSETDDPYLAPESEIEEPYLIPAAEVGEPYSTPEIEIEEPQSIPSREIEEPYSIPAIEVGEPYSTPEIQKEPFFITDCEQPVASSDPTLSESSEAPVSVESEDSGELEESTFSAIAPEAEPSMDDKPLPSPLSPSPSPSASPNKTRTVTLEDIKKANKGVRIRVDGPKGKIGVVVPIGVTMELEDAIIEVPANLVVVVRVEGGNVIMKNVQLLFKQQPRVMRKALQNAKQSMRKQGLSLTNGSSANISNSRFEGGTDSMVSVEKGSSFHCNGCVFHRNIATGTGGAILAEGSSVVLEDCIFSNNTAQYGGAVWMSGAHYGDEAASLKIGDSVFVYNKAKNEGGSMWVKHADKVEVLDSRFSNGIGVMKGGAFVVEATRELGIVGSHFNKNKAKKSSGGAVSIAFCYKAEIQNSTFDSNSAVHGGAVSFFNKPSIEGRVNINSTRFTENKAQNQGGAILIQTTSGDQNATLANVQVSIDQSSFVNNTAANGGAIYVSSESGSNFNLNAEVKNTKFLQNSATNAGGGMYCGKQSKINFDSSFFQQNEAYTGKGCATTCGCSIHQKQTENLELQDATGASSSHCDISATQSTTGEANGSSNTVTYVMVALAVLVALIIVLVGVLSKNKYRFQFNRRTELLRSLTSSDYGAISPRQDLYVPPNESTEDLADEANASEASAGPRIGSYTHGEMDCPTPPRSTDLSLAGSVKSHFLSDGEDVAEA